MDVEAKIKALILIPCAVAPLSIVGSILTLLTIHRTRAGGKSLTTYHRLMASISIFDLILSLGLMLGPVPVPVETGFPYSRGSTVTCSFQGFLLQLGSASFFFNAMLMVYYVLVIRFNVRTDVMATKIEPFLQLTPLLFYFSTAVAGLFLEVYNLAGTNCWIAGSPTGCSEDPSVECERGGDVVPMFGTWLSVVPVFIWTVIIILALAVVAFTVLRRYCRSRRFVFHGSEGSRGVRKQTQQVIIQCVLYALAFLNVTLWSTLATVFEWAGNYLDYTGDHFWMAFLSIFFFPIQGFFNFLIFIRPRYSALRTDCADRGRWFALREAIWNPTESPEARSSDLSSSRGRSFKSRSRGQQSTGLDTFSVPAVEDGNAGDAPPECANPKKSPPLRTVVTETTSSSLRRPGTPEDGIGGPSGSVWHDVVGPNALPSINSPMDTTEAKGCESDDDRGGGGGSDDDDDDCQV